MSLPTQSPEFPVAVGLEDGSVSRGDAAVLESLRFDPPKEFPRACYPCGRKTTWLAEYEMANGWWSICLSCGEEEIVAYTRTVAA